MHTHRIFCIDKIAAYDFWALYQSPVQTVLKQKFLFYMPLLAIECEGYTHNSIKYLWSMTLPSNKGAWVGCTSPLI